MSRFNEILHGDPATLEEHCAEGDLDTGEICAALNNICGQIIEIHVALHRINNRIDAMEERHPNQDTTT